MEQEIDKKMKNEFFMVAVDYLFKEGLVDSQKELAEKIGITESALSRIKNNRKFVGDDTLRKMDEAFGCIFNMPYFRGRSLYLLKEDAAEAMLNSVGKKMQQTSKNIEATPDVSSIMNAALSAQMQTIEALKREATTKDELIADLRARIKEKDDYIAILKSQIASTRTHTDPEKFPFPVGVADDKKQRKNL